MKYSGIENFIKNLILEKLSLSDIDIDTCLFDVSPVYNILYIVEPIESKYKIDFENIIRNKDYKVMTIKNLSESICDLLHDENSFNR